MNRYRIMIVDDDPDIRFVLQNLLSLNFETVGAENGLDALEKVERYEPDLMLLDVNMPVMNGFRCCQGVRRHPQYHDIPVFFLSGYGDRSNYAEAYASGATVYLEKPLNVQQLIQVIEEHFTKRGRPAAAKTFSLDELERVDRTPLHPATQTDFGDGEITQVPILPPEVISASPSRGEPVEQSDAGVPETSVKRRRVFGRGAMQKREQGPTDPDTVREVVAEASPRTVPEAAPSAPSLVDKPTGPLPPPQPSPVPPELSPAEPTIKPCAEPSEPIEPIELTPRYGRVVQSRPVAGPGRLRDMMDHKETSGQKQEDGKQVSLPPAPPAIKPMISEAGAFVKSPLPPSPPAPLPRSPAFPAAPPPPAPPSARVAVPAAAAAAVPSQTKEPAAQPRVMVVNHDTKELVPLAKGIRGVGEFMPLEETGEAIEHIARFQPDVVICPISMKDWDGLQVFEMLRGNARLSHIQVVFLADPREDPVRRTAAERRSGLPLLTRPLQPARVREVLDQVIRQPGFVVRHKRATYGEFVRDVLKKIEKEKENRRRLKEQEAHIQHLSGWAQFLSTELKDYKPPAPAGSSSLRTYYLP